MTFESLYLESGGVRIRAARFEARTPDPARAGPARICVLLNGQTEFIEKYSEVIEELTGRGFAVASLDWRGQGGSQRLTPDPLKGHVSDFADYDRDLDALMREVVEPMTAGTSQKPIALAHSMGGHILLRHLNRRPGNFAAVVLCAPMVAIRPRGVPWWLVARAARWLNRHAPSQDFVWGMVKRDHSTVPFALQIVTSDPARYARTQALLKAFPTLKVNGPTWGWLEAALQSIALLDSPGYAEVITTPSLLLGAGYDLVCDSAALRAFAARLPNARYQEIAGAAHEILMERDVFRAQFWTAFDAFIGRPA